MKITENQILKFNKLLEYGDKKELAKILDVTPQTLSRYFKDKDMPRAKYLTLLAFVESLKPFKYE